MKILTIDWALSEPLRSKPFTESMEAASILCIADSRRRKPKILKSRAETISYLSKLYYPFWIIPHGEGCLIIDGLGLLSHSVKDQNVPDIKSFTEDLNQASADFNLYRRIIDRYVEALKDSESTIEIRIQALIGDIEVLKAVSKFLSEKLRPGMQQTEERSSLLLKLDEAEALAISKRLVNACMNVLSDIRGLQYAIDVLKEEMEHHRDKIAVEIEEIKSFYEMQLNELRPVVNKKIERLKAEEESKITKVIRNQEKRLKAALKEQEKLEREIMRLEKRIENYIAKKMTLKRKDTSYLDAKIEICQNRIEETSERIKVISKIAETIRREGDEKIKAIRDEYEKKIKEEMGKISLLEMSRETCVR